jgi:uncharacterized membrane protein
MNLKSHSKKASVSTESRSVTEHRIHVGPIPPAEDLEKYESVHKGFADRLLIMAEKEQHARIESNRTIIENAKQESIQRNKNLKRGQLFALFSIIILTALCVYIAYLGDTDSAKWIVVSGIVGVVGLFITGRITNRKQQQNSIQ